MNYASIFRISSIFGNFVFCLPLYLETRQDDFLSWLLTLMNTWWVYSQIHHRTVSLSCRSNLRIFRLPEDWALFHLGAQRGIGFFPVRPWRFQPPNFFFSIWPKKNNAVFPLTRLTTLFYPPPPPPPTLQFNWQIYLVYFIRANDI